MLKEGPLRPCAKCSLGIQIQSNKLFLNVCYVSGTALGTVDTYIKRKQFLPSRLLRSTGRPFTTANPVITIIQLQSHSVAISLPLERFPPQAPTMCFVPHGERWFTSPGKCILLWGGSQLSSPKMAGSLTTQLPQGISINQRQFLARQ